MLARSFFNKIQLKNGKQIEGISNEAMELLVQYPWPGNICELKSVFEFAFVSCSGRMIDPLRLPQTILSGEQLSAATTEPPKELVLDRHSEAGMHKM